MKNKDIQTFDVAIFGAGIAGSLCAARLSKKKLRVILIEKKPSIPSSKDTLVTQSEYVKKFGLKKNVILNKGNTLSYLTYPERIKSSFTNKQIGISEPIVLDCNKFIKNDIETATKNKCIFKINDEIHKIKKIDDYSLIYLKTEEISFKAKIVIDATGTSCAVGKKLNVFKQRLPVGYTYTFLTAGDNIKNPKEAFFEVEKFCRWFWIYPISHSKSFAGLYTFKKETYDNFEQEINAYLSKHGHEYTKYYNEEFGLSFLNDFSPIKNKKIVVDNVLFLGESGGTTTPLLGEGFRPIAEIVIWLENNIEDILKEKKRLSDVQDHFFSTTGRDYSLMRAILPIILKLNHKESKELMQKYILKLDPKQLYKFTIVKQDRQEWIQMLTAVSRSLTIYRKLFLGLTSPINALKLMNELKKRKLISSIFDLL
ncbi:MAG: NAD(P)-binding protein [Candidatus Woesearchaeota archaeon]